MKKPSFLALSSVAVISLVPFAQANPIETVEVVGSRSGLGPADLSGQISVIERSEIELLNKTSVQSLLDSLAGVSVNQQGGAGGVTSLYIRGGEANFAVILIDGVQVNNPVDTRGGSFDFSTLDPSQVERIELIRGPQSALYGADALSGVLNIITRQPDADGGAVLGFEGGDDDYYRGRAYLGGSFGQDGRYSLALGRSDSGDVVEDSERELDFLTGSLVYDFSEDSSLSAGLRYSDSERSNYPEDSGGPEFAVWDELDQGESEDLSLHLSWQSKATQLWQYQLTADWFNIESEESSPGIFPGFEIPPTGADVEFDRYSLSWVNRLQLDALRLGVGMDFEREEGDSQGYIDYGFPLDASFELERDTYGGFAELHYDVSKALALSGSVRYDDVDESDSEVTSRLGLLWRLANGATQLRANWGEGFKPPSFFALAHPLVGNPDLQSETSSSWDVGIEHRFNDGVSLNLVYFDTTYRDLVDFDDETFRNVNRDRVETNGVEFSFTATLGGYGDLRGHATYADSNVANSDVELRGRPDWKAGLQWFYSVKSNIGLAAEYLWVDEVIEASQHTGQSLDYTLDAYNTLDISLNWQVSDSIKLKATVSNVLDENYEQAVGFPAAGIFPRLGVEWRP